MVIPTSSGFLVNFSVQATISLGWMVTCFSWCPWCFFYFISWVCRREEASQMRSLFINLARSTTKLWLRPYFLDLWVWLSPSDGIFFISQWAQGSLQMSVCDRPNSSAETFLLQYKSPKQQISAKLQRRITGRTFLLWCLQLSVTLSTTEYNQGLRNYTNIFFFCSFYVYKIGHRVMQ